MPGNAKILIVEDDPDMVEATRLILESRSYDVLTASDATEAMEQLTAGKPDLILLDIMMPDGTEGFQFVWQVRNELPDDLANVPIVVISAIHDYTELRFYPEQSDGTYQPGEFLPVQGFIDKPVEPADLLARVEQAIRRK